jgi:hypothetical protein
MVALNAEAARLTLEARNPHITAAVDSGVLVVTGWTLSSAYLRLLHSLKVQLLAVVAWAAVCSVASFSELCL